MTSNARCVRVRKSSAIAPALHASKQPEYCQASRLLPRQAILRRCRLMHQCRPTSLSGTPSCSVRRRLMHQRRLSSVVVRPPASVSAVLCRCPTAHISARPSSAVTQPLASAPADFCHCPAVCLRARPSAAVAAQCISADRPLSLFSRSHQCPTCLAEATKASSRQAGRWSSCFCCWAARIPDGQSQGVPSIRVRPIEPFLRRFVRLHCLVRLRHFVQFRCFLRLRYSSRLRCLRRGQSLHLLLVESGARRNHLS